MYFKKSETIPFACYILFNESLSKGYNDPTKTISLAFNLFFITHNMQSPHCSKTRKNQSWKNTKEYL